MARKKKDEQVPAPVTTVDPADVKTITIQQLAKRLGCHRVTLVRMEQRGVIPQAIWKMLPVQHRAYSENDVVKIGELIRQHNYVKGRVYE